MQISQAIQRGRSESPFRFAIDFSREFVIVGSFVSTIPSLSPALTVSVSRASFRSSFFTASAAGILTSYVSSRSYMSFTC